MICRAELHVTDCVCLHMCPASLLQLLRGSSGDIILTLTPGAQSAVQGQTVSIRCKSDRLIGDDINWYLQKPGESGVPESFCAKAEQTDFTLTISGVQAEDAGVYYCQQRNSFPLTQERGTDLTHQGADGKNHFNKLKTHYFY
uniref:Ig-like domain-containing protein n=1 Tax=Xiphophorus maculatus TaxID=8083 RepID=A0A3B5R0C4_XIPMA